MAKEKRALRLGERAAMRWSGQPDQLRRWECEALPLFIRAVALDRPEWTEHMGAALEEFLCETGRRELRLQQMFTTALRTGSLYLWAG